MIRTTITPTEFQKLTWVDFENVASDINDIEVSLVNGDEVKISVLGYEIRTMKVSDYNAILSA
jgi:hypothetical protein